MSITTLHVHESIELSPQQPSRIWCEHTLSLSSVKPLNTDHVMVVVIYFHTWKMIVGIVLVRVATRLATSTFEIFGSVGSSGRRSSGDTGKKS